MLITGQSESSHAVDTASVSSSSIVMDDDADSVTTLMSSFRDTSMSTLASTLHDRRATVAPPSGRTTDPFDHCNSVTLAARTASSLDNCSSAQFPHLWSLNVVFMIYFLSLFFKSDHLQ